MDGFRLGQRLGYIKEIVLWLVIVTGKITYERFVFLNDKLTQWYYESIEMEDE